MQKMCRDQRSQRAWGPRVAFAVLFIVAARSGAEGTTDDPLGNWFNDPFAQVRSAVADCPLPMGPLLRKSEVRAEEHSRVERGTSCYLAGQCEKPNAYFYDADIGEALKERFAATKDYAHKSVPHVELVFVNVRLAPDQKLPYAVNPAPAKS
ncbi:MAG: hypothetical protein ABSF50_22330 [Burkholderiaceae bacterium]